jgi:FtsP/CotA-like multicopper oxidase with cupredoxin domain
VKKGIKIILSALLLILIVGGGFVFWTFKHSVIPDALNMGSQAADSTQITELTMHKTNAPTKTFNLTAEAAQVNLGNGKTIKAWTFNGTAPGPELRVTQGDKVVVHLTNKLNVGVTIHWHGVNVPGAEDGIAGVTQNAVKPGGTYTYSFIADQP